MAPAKPDAPADISWTVPTFPHEPIDEPALLEVPNAYLTPVRHGPLRTVVTPTRWLRGAVHDADGVLIVASQKIGGLGGNEGAQADPRRVKRRPEARRLTGTWLYGGHWIAHFGHFFTETLTTLWPARADLDVQGLVFHRYFGTYRGVQPWQRELVDFAGYGDLPIEVVDGQAVGVERLLLPSRSVVVNGWAHPGARDVWDRMVAAVGPATAVPDGGDRVFFSRRVFNEAQRDVGKVARTSAQRDERLDRVFADAGFRVVAPETLSVRAQIQVAAGASVIAGSAGTALHLSAFAPSGTKVIELGDNRSPTVQVPQQRVIDHLRNHPTAFVPLAVGAPQLRRVLRDLGCWG